MIEFEKALRDKSFGYVSEIIENSRTMLKATVNKDTETVEQILHDIHNSEIPILQYNDENFLSCTIQLAFYFAREYYTMIREMPAGKGFADICMVPRKKHPDKPAVVVELKWDKSAGGAIEQIKEKQYGDALKEYQGKLLLAGINYNKMTKKHECVIETMQK